MSFYCCAVQTENHNEFTFASGKICLVLQLAVSDSRMMCTYSLEYIPPLPRHFSWHQAKTDLMSHLLQSGLLTNCQERLGHQ